MKCINCGAEIGYSKVCEYCGTHIFYSEQREQELLKKQGCPKCGSSNISFKRENQGTVQYKKSRRTIYQTVGLCKDCGYTWYPNTQIGNNQSKSMVWWILGWIFFFPAPVMVLIWRKKNTWNVKVKIGVTVAFWLVVLIIGLSGNNNNSIKYAVESETEKESESKDIIETIPSEPMIATRDNNTEEDNITSFEEVRIDLMDIINIKGHPVYYDETKKAKEVWDNYIGKEVFISPKTYDHTENAVLIIKDLYDIFDEEQSRIVGFDIYLNKMEDPVSLDQALNIASDFLPIELMKQYYSFEESYIIAGKDLYMHIVHYKVTEEGLKIREETKESIFTMPYEIYVMLDGEESISLLRITEKLENEYWESNHWNNVEERIEWDYDFLSGLSSKDNSLETSSYSEATEPVEFDSLQKLFLALPDMEGRDEIDFVMREYDEFKCHKFNGNLLYYVGLSGGSVSSRSRDRNGESIDIHFNRDGTITSGIYENHPSSDHKVEYINHSFLFDSTKCESGETAMQLYLTEQRK